MLHKQLSIFSLQLLELDNYLTECVDPGFNQWLLSWPLQCDQD